MISTRLTERLGIRHPIVCAPMAFVTGGSLAAAVSRAGGLGIVTTTASAPACRAASICDRNCTWQIVVRAFIEAIGISQDSQARSTLASTQHNMRPGQLSG